MAEEELRLPCSSSPAAHDQPVKLSPSGSQLTPSHATPSPEEDPDEESGAQHKADHSDLRGSRTLEPLDKAASQLLLLDTRSQLGI